MRNLKIRNIGPVENLDIELGKLNVFIGPQSSGKSTITKIACYCSWVEKRIALLNRNEEQFKVKGVFAKELIRFHKLTGYLQSDSYIYFESDALILEYCHSEEKPSFVWKDRFLYKRGKISYIPSERNMVAAVPNWIDIKFIDNNIRSFMSDWSEARSIHKKDNPLNILNIGAKYFFDGENDKIVINGNAKTLDLTNTSSGFQSLTPLLVLLNYFYDWIFHHDNPKSIKDLEEEKEIIEDLKRNVTNQKLNLFLKNFQEIHHSNIFLEEPEQNLFPKTQRDLIYKLAELINLNEEHSLTVATHSPYILTSINNLLYAHQIGQNKRDEAKIIVPDESWIDFDNVRAYFVNDGEVRSILDKETRQIEAEAIDEVSSILNKEYEDLLALEE